MTVLVSFRGNIKPTKWAFTCGNTLYKIIWCSMCTKMMLLPWKITHFTCTCVPQLKEMKSEYRNQFVHFFMNGVQLKCKITAWLWKLYWIQNKAFFIYLHWRFQFPYYPFLEKVPRRNAHVGQHDQPNS